MLNEHGEDFEQERLRLVIEGTRLGMWDWNPQTDEVVFNDLWAEMLGHRIEEIPFTLESWSSRVHPDDLDGCYADITRHINGETSFYENIHRMRHKDGSWRYILDRGRIVERDADGNPTRFTGTHTDLTPQIEAELAAKEALKAKDRFLARVSHEIRPPLHGVLGLVGLLDQTGLNEEQRAITAHMRGSGETLLVLINDLLDVTKAAEGKLLLDPTAVDVAELTGEVAALFHPLAATKGLSVDWRCDDALPARVFVDGHRLKQVLSNLLSNAIKFTEHGGIRLEACVDRTAEGERVVFRLEDDGMGIAHPDRPRARWHRSGPDGRASPRGAARRRDRRAQPRRDRDDVRVLDPGARGPGGARCPRAGGHGRRVVPRRTGRRRQPGQPADRARPARALRRQRHGGGRRGAGGAGLP
jgi:PAS domain S-box-containing protein